MSLITIPIHFYRYSHHDDLVNDLQAVYTAKTTDTVLFSIDLNASPKLVYGDFLVLLVAVFNYLKNKSVEYFITFEKFSPQHESNRYISRIDFFKYAQFEFEEEFVRQNSEGRFTEITPFSNYADAKIIHDKIINILLAASAINESTLKMLEYSLWEIIDNVLNHSGCKIGGFCQMQLFPKMREIRIIVCDKGIGIHKALTTPEQSKFKHLSESESIIECTKKGVTNGDGMGNGLYHASEFIKHNKGTFVLHSGNYLYKITNGIVNSYEAAFWDGVYFFMKVNTTVDVDYKLIMDGYDLDNSFDFLFGDE